MKYYVVSHLSENIHETPEGFLLCIGVPIARTGEMNYGEGETPLETDDQGKIVIDRKADEVFRPETMASFEGKAVTLSHPKDFVGPQNWSSLAKGVIQNVRRGKDDEENDLIADLLITDSTAIYLVKNGLREVSCGYEAEYTQTGEGRGFQSNIVGNHLALVQEGRAGSSYAINDHKGKGSIMKLKEKIKAIFAKAQDEAMNLAADAEPEKKEDDKPVEKSKDAAAYDELIKMVKDLGEKVSAMAKPAADVTSPATENEPAKTVAKDDEVASSLEDRLKALEMSVAKLLEMQAPVGDKDGEVEESEDAESEESEDDAEADEGSLTGDAASRVEILAPGLKLTKDAKEKALKAAYATEDGKSIIDSLSGGKTPLFNSDTLFIAASELLKAKRSTELSKTKHTRGTTDSGAVNVGKGLTAEEVNEANARFYAQK